MDISIIHEHLRSNPNLESVPDHQLLWLIEHSKLRSYEKGAFLFQKDDDIDHMVIMLEGKVSIYFLQKDRKRELSLVEKDSVSGVLPFSRLRTAVGYAEVLEPTKVLLTHRDQFESLVTHNFQLAEKLVHLLTTRVREFTSSQQQNEKMMALGKLSAGLAHELNNPAAAIVRSSDSLMSHLSTTPEDFKAVMSIKVTEEQVDQVNDILFSRLGKDREHSLSLKQRTMVESELMDWLEDRDIENADDITDNLIEYCLGEAELDQIESILQGEQLGPVLSWLNNVMTTERTVGDIHEASKRISELIQSVKSYSHMDRDHEKVRVDIQKGLQDTLNLLVHKIKRGNVEVIRNFAEDLPLPCVNPGELNQVWTNIIDNAIDAMEETSNAQIEIKTFTQANFVLVEVIDNGPGIPDEVISRIFDPFYTTKEVGKGSGLGLDIAMKIVKQHNGSLKVNSEPGKTTFQVCLPIDDK